MICQILCQMSCQIPCHVKFSFMFMSDVISNIMSDVKSYIMFAVISEGKELAKGLASLTWLQCQKVCLMICLMFNWPLVDILVTFWLKTNKSSYKHFLSKHDNWRRKITECYTSPTAFNSQFLFSWKLANDLFAAENGTWFVNHVHRGFLCSPIYWSF